MLKDILTNSAIAATGGGIWSYIMITRERRAREAAEQAKEAAEQALAEERQRAEERVAEERRRADERVAEERRRADERVAEERNLFFAEIERLTRRLDDRQQGPSE